MKPTNDIPTLALPSGERIPRLGFGTWGMGERSSAFSAEVAAIQCAMDCGLQLFDTAEMYGDGGAEKVLGKAINGQRDNTFIVSKVYPHNASRTGTIKACERSLARLETDYIDLYLLHWRGQEALQETLDAFCELQDSGKIRHFGVSNFDVDDLEDWTALNSTRALAANQVLYNLMRRWPEARLLSWCESNQLPIMAYTPLEPISTGQAHHLETVARRHNATPAQVALAFVLHQSNVITIPKSVQPERIRENLNSLKIELTQQDLSDLSTHFPAPQDNARMELI